MKKWSNYTGFVFVLLLMVACKGNSSAGQETLFGGVMSIAVDQTLAPLAEEEIAVFESRYQYAGILPEYTNEVEAINLLLKDSVRFVIATRPLSGEETESFHSRKFFPRSIKIATDGIALIVHRQNADSIVNLDMLQQIFSGKVTDWKELPSRSASGEIQIVFDHPNSSTVRYVIDSICRGEPLSGRCRAAGTNQRVIDYVARTPGALGVIGVNWISEDQDSLCKDFRKDIQVMRVSRSREPSCQNSYQPYQYYLYTGQYPLRRDIYILLNDPKGGLPTGLTSFITGAQGQRIILKAGLLPATMPVNIVDIRSEL